MSYDPLTTVDEFKIWQAKPQGQTASDAVIGQLIAALSEEIGRYCDRDNLGLVLPYTERWAPVGTQPYYRDPEYVLRAYPVTALTSVAIGSTAVPVITDLTGQTSGALLDSWESNPRRVSLVGYRVWPCTGPLVVQYQAGYWGANAPSGTKPTVPTGLKQVLHQWINEVLVSRISTGQKSQTLAGQTVTYELGEKFGMSPRTKAMLEPYRNRVPLYH